MEPTGHGSASRHRNTHHVRFDAGQQGFTHSMLAIFGPFLLLFSVTALATIALALYGWHMEIMLVVAALAGTAVFVLAIALGVILSTERRRSEHERRRIEDRVAGLLESAMDAIITVDAKQNVVFFNAAAEKVFRWPRETMIGQPLDRLIPQRFHAEHRQHVERFGAKGVTSRRMGDQTVITGLRANGEEFPIEASISQAGEGEDKLFTVILRDVTERVAADRQLARSEGRMRGILDSAMDAIITVDENQHIVLFNAAAEAVFGCPRSEAIGAPLSWFIPERYRAEHGAHMRRFGETGQTSRRMGSARSVVVGLRRSGEEFPIEASISQIDDNAGKFYTVILRDITERVRAENDLRRTQEELRQFATVANSVREQEKSRIARELHDELGQALTALKMDVNWMLEAMPADQPALSGKLEKMRALLDTTVASTRRISSELRPLLLDDLGLVPAIEWLADNFRAQNAIDCELHVDPALDIGEPYATAIFRILQESLTNISRHAHASLVEINVSRINDESHDEVCLSVRDNGRGFEITTARKPDSHGLTGLRERAYMLDGEVHIDSARGRGTQIEVRIPLVTKEEAA